MAFLIGCGPNKAIIMGKVTYKDQAVGSGRVDFFNTKDEPVGTAGIQKDGTFTATDIPLVEVKVTVNTSNIMAKMPKMSSSDKGGSLPPVAETGPVVQIPEKYKQVKTTTLVFPITSRSQQLDVKLD
jgi:hypothetical protein